MSNRVPARQRTRSRRQSASERIGTEGAPHSRWLALLAVGLLLFAVTFTLYDLVDVVGDADTYLAMVGASLLAATGFARVVRTRTALWIGALVLAVGVAAYAAALPTDPLAQWDHLRSDLVSLLSGLSVLRLQKIEVWALTVTPAPVFLTWFLALRRRYLGAVVAAGSVLLFLVLTGDVGTVVALLGVVGGMGAVGFGRLERFGGSVAGAETVAIVVAVAVLVTLTVSVVPGGGAQPFALFGGGGSDTLEGSLISADERVTIRGATDLSPAVRFTVESDRDAYWRVAGYQRYTGTGWVRTRQAADAAGGLANPPRPGASFRQTVTIESRLDAMPAAWRPVSVSGDAASTAMVTASGGLRPASPLTPGDRYTVTSRAPEADPLALRRAGTDYPPGIVERYTSLPGSTPDRVAVRTADVVGDAETPYEKALAIESWLAENKGYSLDVRRPDAHVADAFLFEMDAGYCTYFATTMVAMLRTQDVPARFVTGYLPGEREDDEWVVRGLDSHAWVEVYLPDVGWVQFDPTPADPREAAEDRSLADAPGSGDGDDSQPEPADLPTPDPVTPDHPSSPTPTPDPSDPDPGTPSTTRPTTTAEATTPTPTPDGEAGGGFTVPRWPSGEEWLLGLLVVGGVAAGIRRTGLAARVSRALWVRWQPRRDPAADVERAFERLEWVLAATERPRRPGETPRQYLAAIGGDEQVARVYAHYERLRYAGETSPAAADDAVATVNEVVRERL